MINHRHPFRSTTLSAKRKFHNSIKLFCLFLLALLFAIAPAQAQEEGPEAQYLHILNLVEEADSLMEKDQSAPAKARYQEAQSALLKLRKSHPTWNVRVVNYRLNYLHEKIAGPPPAASPEDANSSAANTTQRTAKPSTTAASGSPFKLLHAGAEPKSQLRFQPTAGDQQQLVITAQSKTRMGATETGEEIPQAPAYKMTLLMTVKNVSDNGDIDYEMIVEDAGPAEDSNVTPDVAEAMKKYSGDVKGAQLTGKMSNRGLIKAIEAENSSGTPADALRMGIKEMFSNLKVILPEEAVGPGAKWEVKEKITSHATPTLQKLTIDQVTEYRLISAQDGNLIIETSSAHNAAKQNLSNPANPQQKVQLAKLIGITTSTNTISLAKIYPSQVTSTGNAKMTLEFSGGGKKQTMIMRTETSVSMESK